MASATDDSPVSAAPTVSPDGRFYVRDGRWEPLPGSGTRQPVDGRSIVSALTQSLAGLFLAIVVFPIVLGASVMAVLRVAPESLGVVAAVATIVVLLGVLWFALRRLF